MLAWAFAFLVIAVVAGVLGFGGIAGIATGIAKILFFVFVILSAASLLAGRGRPPAPMHADRPAPRRAAR
jgi:uncharacterized membrane protein YtjA (UPF0391 family)